MSGVPTPEEIARLPYRPCVGIMLTNAAGQVWVGQRDDRYREAWQMPQGGVDPGEDIPTAALRELGEEIGVSQDLIKILARTAEAIPYDLPAKVIPTFHHGRFRGQAQIWVLARFLGVDDQIDIATPEPEFRSWKWCDKDELVANVVPFKREVYARVVAELGPLI